MKNISLIQTKITTKYWWWDTFQ